MRGDRIGRMASVLAVLMMLGLVHGAAAECDGGCPVDLDGCGSVGIVDLLMLLGDYGPCPECPADFNGDDVVNGHDLGYLLGHWGLCLKPLPFPTPTTVELVIVEITDPVTMGKGYREFDLSVQLDNPDDLLLNVLDANASCDEALCFVQAFPGAGALPLAEEVWKLLDLTYDSYVTIGARFQDFNVSIDPNFSEADFSKGTALGTDAGWFTTPDSGLGIAGNYPDHRILIATFTIPMGTTVEGGLSVIYQDAADQLFLGSPSFVIEVGGPCPWDCGGDNNGNVGTVDLLALLAQWGQQGGSCDFNGRTVGTSELLELLANWGPCPK